MDINLMTNGESAVINTGGECLEGGKGEEAIIKRKELGPTSPLIFSGSAWAHDQLKKSRLGGDTTNLREFRIWFPNPNIFKYACKSN